MTIPLPQVDAALIVAMVVLFCALLAAALWVRPELRDGKKLDRMRSYAIGAGALLGSILLLETFRCTSTAVEALEAIRTMCRNIRRLQQIQRNGYNHMADDGIHTLATSYIPAVVKRVEWPKQAGPWLESIALSCAKIGASAKQRQVAHHDHP